ncbi:TonB-dependent receptor plug domain-containing protein [Moraxella sp. ZY210820]|uniref:TonB-dependent receptor plug domain-containing protein n=1 Tax=unclassified Moraxella TaxID=2685852 RepID=UPI0027313189|nr:TonB-dependent receptor plug domain-containing protein [Moraxella sp. ZY210820]WLF83206.1 TonB-dependent receptor plug domain-containing protein [Moraxella sp. ZY210820]
MKKRLIALLIMQILCTASYANTSETAVQAEDMTTIEVIATPFSQKMGTQTLTAEQIAKLPTRNGSLTELLRSNPAVQFSNTTNTSTAGGELEPETVSFHGEKFYNNNFMIDGLSNNNNIDPLATSGTAGKLGDLVSGNNAWDLPAGGDQSLWIDSNLIDSVEVFDSNISAKYGNFTGGVIDAKIKDPDFTRPSGRISWRSTRDSWTSFHIDEKIRENFEQADFIYYQPRFTKNFYSASYNQPLTDKASVLFSYNRQESEIPTYQSWANAWRNQQRLNETYLIKGLYKFDGGDTLSATAMYAPHSTSTFRRGIKDGGFENTGGGYRINMDWNHIADWGKVKTTLGYQQDENTVINEADHYYPWYHRFGTQTSSVITWATGLSSPRQQTGLQGGHGKYATDKKSFTAKQDYELSPFNLWASEHHLKAGWEYYRDDVKYQRFNETSLGGNMIWNTAVICQTKDDGCITGEQYSAVRLLYPARQVSAHMNRYAGYLENVSKLGRVELTSGVRIAYDDFMKNTTISPRFSFTADIFDNENTRLFGGWNRYHSNSFYSYALKKGISTYTRQNRTLHNGTLSDWVDGATTERSNSKYSHDVTGLATPYSDEINVGIAQKLGNSLWTLKWVNRDSKKSFARSQTRNENGEQIMDNSGWSKSDTISLTARPHTPITFDSMDLNWSLSAQWSKHKQNTANDYDTTDAQDELKAIHEGKLINREDLPAMDYNTPWSLTADIDMTFPKLNLTWGHRLDYRAGYTGYSTTQQECPLYDANICADYVGRATLYEKTKFNDHINYNMRFTYKQPTFKNQSLELTLDINNVFDKKIATYRGTSSTSSVSYQMGRNFWLGVAYNF